MLSNHSSLAPTPRRASTPWRWFVPLVLVALAPLVGSPASAENTEAPPLRHPEEIHLADIRQLTFVGENAEAYWSPDGEELILQANRPPFECDQIFRLAIDRPGELELVSTGKGRTTCAYFTPDGERVIYSSTHQAEPGCPPVPDHSMGYVWPLYDSFEIYSARRDGSDLRALTDNQVYDAEATLCPIDGSMVFTSTRDGDLELYRMDADGSNVVRLTETPGYDGGAFFSSDCSKIVWRASRPKEGAELDDFRALLARGLVRPSKLELWVANADGSDARQVTYLDAASFAPYFFPDGRRILFSTNYGDPRGREFDIWAIDIDGTNLEQITHTPGFDGFPMFSPDGRQLAFASNRHQAQPGWTDVYVARWVGDAGDTPVATGDADRYHDHVAWLADDARQGRGVGTDGIEAAADWLAERFAEVGVEPGAAGSWFQSFEVPMRVESGPGTQLSIDGQSIATEDFVIASFATPGEAEGEIVPVGYGISAPELGHDDYAGVDVAGKIALVRRFTPDGGTPDGGTPDGETHGEEAEASPFSGTEGTANRRRYGDLRYKAWTAREHGAVAVLIVDLPVVAEGAELPAESPLPSLRVERQSDAGVPALVVGRDVAAPLFAGGRHAALKVEKSIARQGARNVVGRIAAGAEDRLPGALVVGAHYDHLGFGDAGSLEPEAHEPHNGADDNASGTASLIEIGRRLVEQREALRRDVLLVAFSGEESGLRGSTHFTLEPPEGIVIDELVAMLNLDMVGRLRDNRVAVLGGSSAEEWGNLLPPICEANRIGCQLGGDGYGPSDQTPFYAAGIPVLHFFTGTHEQYHRPSDDTSTINAGGAVRVAAVVADLAAELSRRPDTLTYLAAAAPEPAGDQRSYGASLGTIPDYAAEGKTGVKLAGTRPGGPADTAGMQRGDVLVELSGHEIRDIYDFMYVLRQSKPGEVTTGVVERGGKRVELEITFGQSRRVQ